MNTLTDRLENALAIVHEASALTGRQVPADAAAWAVSHGLEVLESEFAPPGNLYLVATLEVPM